MTKICTTIEQSKKLMELGIDVHTADMYWLNRHIDLTETKYESFVVDRYNKHIDFFNSYAVAVDNNEIVPSWSLSALLGLMPKNESKTIDLCLGGSNGVEHTFDWFCTCDENEDPYGYKTFHSKSPIDCTFEMICWLKENEMF